MNLLSFYSNKYTVFPQVVLMPGKEHLHECYVKGRPIALELLKVTISVSSKPVTIQKALSAQHPGSALSIRFTQEGCDTEVQPLDPETDVGGAGMGFPR